MLAERIERIALIEPLTQSGYLEPAGQVGGYVDVDHGAGRCRMVEHGTRDGNPVGGRAVEADGRHSGRVDDAAWPGRDCWDMAIAGTSNNAASTAAP